MRTVPVYCVVYILHISLSKREAIYHCILSALGKATLRNDKSWSKPRSNLPPGTLVVFTQAPRHYTRFVIALVPQVFLHVFLYIFSVKRRFRIKGSESLTHSLTEWMLADLTDMALVSDDTLVYRYSEKKLMIP